MSRLKALFQKGFMKLTGGKRIVLVARDEMISNKEEIRQALGMYCENEKLKKEIQILKKEKIDEFERGRMHGIAHSLPLTCCRPKDGKLLAVISLIANELIEQADFESCEWLYHKIYQCRSL